MRLPHRALNFTALAGASSTFRAPKRFEIQSVTTLQEVRDRFARDQGLPFAASLSQDSILDALHRIIAAWALKSEASGR